jgi:hypothetical protein
MAHLGEKGTFQQQRGTGGRFEHPGDGRRVRRGLRHLDDLVHQQRADGAPWSIALAPSQPQVPFVPTALAMSESQYAMHRQSRVLDNGRPDQKNSVGLSGVLVEIRLVMRLMTSPSSRPTFRRSGEHGNHRRIGFDRRCPPPISRLYRQLADQLFWIFRRRALRRYFLIDQPAHFSRNILSSCDFGFGEAICRRLKKDFAHLTRAATCFLASSSVLLYSVSAFVNLAF